MVYRVYVEKKKELANEAKSLFNDIKTMNNTMKRLLLSVWLLSLSLLSAVAENYPYKSDVLWVTVPNHADWLYKTGEKVTVEVQFYKYGIPTPELSWALTATTPRLTMSLTAQT